MRRLIIALAAVCLVLMAASAWADEYTVSLLHFNGDTTDAMGRSWSTLAGTPVASTTQSKFGGGSLYLDGSSAITTANSSDFDFGSGNWTIEWWQYPTDSNHLMMFNDDGVNWPGVWGTTADFGAPGLAVCLHDGGGTYKNIGSILAGQWSHIAIVRAGSQLITFQNGVLIDAGSVSGSVYSGANGVKIGLDYSATYFTGYIDELRISKGIARWNTGFDVPTEEYTDAAEIHGPSAYLCSNGKIILRSGGKLYLKE